jgi:hypothetical protein
MSNIFITDIIGAGDFAVPIDDAALATATTELDALLGGVANLSYDRVLAWVETNNGASPPRTLNCVVEKFEYSGEECPDSTETQTMTAAIESTLEGDPDITSIGVQQVHIFQAGPYFLWDRYSGPGYVFPSISTDDVIVGGLAAPAGKWFDDGDIVLGDDVMSGSERTRVVGNARIEGGFLMTEQASVPISPGAGEGVFWVYNNGAGETRPYFTDDAGVDHELATTGTSVSLPKIEHVVWVDKTSAVYSADGTRQAPYNTIAAAITEAAGMNCDTNGTGDIIGGTAPNMTLTDAAGLFRADMVGNYITIVGATTAGNNGTFIITGYTSSTNISYTNASGFAEAFSGTWLVPFPVAIIVHPGIYSEALTVANGFISIIGLDRESTIIRQSSGTNPPLTLQRANTSFENLTFEVTNTHTGYVVYSDIDAGSGKWPGDVTFRNCNVLGTAGAAGNYFGYGGGSDHFFYDCTFMQSTPTAFIYDGSGSASSYEYFFGCYFYGVVRSTASSRKTDAYDCRFVTSDDSVWLAPVVFLGNGSRRFFNCTFTNNAANGNGVHQTGSMDPAAEFYNCAFSANGTGNSIYAGNTGYYVVSGCSMNRGMNYLVAQRTKIRYAGGTSGDLDWYADLDQACRSLLNITENQDTIVYMGADYNGSFQPTASVNFTIDGRRKFTITTVAITPTTQSIKYKDVKIVGQIRMNNGSSVYLERAYISGGIDMFRSTTSTDRLVIHDSAIIGSGSYTKCISFRYNFTFAGLAIISKSYMKGYAGNAAIDFGTMPANDTIRMEYSKVFHGSLGTNNPFTGYTSVTAYDAHHTTFNQEPALSDPTNLTNNIDSGQRYNTIDPDGDFDTMNDPF